MKSLTVYDLMRTIPREKWVRLIRCGVVSESVLLHMDVVEFFHNHTDRALGVMDRYAITARKFKLSESNVRRIVTTLKREQW